MEKTVLKRTANTFHSNGRPLLLDDQAGMLKGIIQLLRNSIGIITEVFLTAVF